MTPCTLDLDMTQGLTFTETLTLKLYNGDPLDITGWAFSATARQVDYNNTINLKPVITDGVNGVIVMYLMDEETALISPADYEWDLIAENASGEKLGIYVQGALTVAKSITIP